MTLRPFTQIFQLLTFCHICVLTLSFCVCTLTHIHVIFLSTESFSHHVPLTLQRAFLKNKYIHLHGHNKIFKIRKLNTDIILPNL